MILGRLTILINVVLALVGDGEESRASYILLFAHGAEALGENHNFVARDVVLLDRFADDYFGSTVGVDIRRVPLPILSQPHTIDCLES